MQQVQCHEWWYESHANKQKNIKTRFQDLEQCDESFYVTYMYKTEETVRKHFVEQTVIRRIDTGVVYTASTNCWLQSGIQSRWMRKKNKKKSCSLTRLQLRTPRARVIACKTKYCEKYPSETNSQQWNSQTYCHRRSETTFALFYTKR